MDAFAEGLKPEGWFIKPEFLNELMQVRRMQAAWLSG